MGDEQTILLGPEDELTSVRERLENTQARRIVLVIPAQTQLRSHVGWRLIHARMRELNKELLVISPDQQVRAVARAAGFQVAETQRETPSNRPRLGGTRPGSTHSKGAGRSRIGSRGEPESQAPQSPDGRRRLTSHASNKPATHPPTPSKSSYKADEETLARLRNREIEASQRPKNVPATFFEEPKEHTGPAYDFSMRATPAIPSQDEDEGTDFKNTYEVDYQTAQNILKAAKEGSTIQERPQQPAEAGSSYFEEVEEEISDITSKPVEIIRGDIEDLGETDSLDLPEIHPDRAFGTPSARPPKQNARPRPGSSTLQPSTRRSPRAPRPNTPGFDDDDDDELLPIPGKLTRDASGHPRPSRDLNRGQRPSQALNTRTSQRPSQALDARPSQRPSQALDARPSQRPSQAFDARPSQRPSQALDARPSQRPSQALNTRTSQRPSQALDARPSQRPSQALDTRPSQRPSQALDVRPSQRPSQALDARPSQRPSQAGANMRAAAGGQRPSSQQGRPPTRQQAANGRRATKRNSRGMAIFLVALTLLVVAALALFYYVPAATVTISLYTSSYTQNVHLNVTTNPQEHAPNSVLAHVLVQNFSASGSGSPTGKTQVGNAQAKGSVTFINTGHANVTIPTNTLVATQSGIQFVTGAEAVVPGNNAQLPVPVVAQQSGESGNVAANTIIVIPPASLSSIAQHSHLSPTSVTADNLTITNDAATSGGGAVPVPTVKQSDVQALATTLHKKVQQEVQTWLNAQIHAGDVRGALVPDILASSTLLNEEQMSTVPPVGQTVNSATFTGTLTVHMSVQVVRATDVQAAAGRSLNTAALQLHPAKVLAAQLPIILAHVTPVQSGSTLTISAEASGQLIPQLDPNAIASSITNQGFSQATHDLKSGIGIPNLIKVKDVQISIFPSFFTIMPVQAGRIRVILEPIQAAPPPPVKNGP